MIANKDTALTLHHIDPINPGSLDIPNKEIVYGIKEIKNIYNFKKKMHKAFRAEMLMTPSFTHLVFARAFYKTDLENKYLKKNYIKVINYIKVRVDKDVVLAKWKDHQINNH